MAEKSALHAVCRMLMLIFLAVGSTGPSPRRHVLQKKPWNSLHASLTRKERGICLLTMACRQGKSRSSGRRGRRQRSKSQTIRLQNIREQQGDIFLLDFIVGMIVVACLSSAKYLRTWKGSEEFSSCHHLLLPLLASK